MEQLQLTDGAHLSYQRMGSGTPLLLIHAPGIGSVNFSYQAPLAATCELIIPDLRGHGDSSPFQTPFSLSKVADDLAALISRLGHEQVVLFGYSQGAAIALECLLRYPDLFAGAVLVSGYSEVSDVYLHTRFYLAQAMASLHGVSLLARSTASSHLTDEAEQRRWIAHGEKTDAYTLHHLYIAGHQFHCTNVLSEISQPVLLLYGEQDKPMHRYAALLAKGLPSAELHFIPGVKHQLVTRAWESCNRLTGEFIRRVAKTAEPVG